MLTMNNSIYKQNNTHQMTNIRMNVEFLCTPTVSCDDPKNLRQFLAHNKRFTLNLNNTHLIQNYINLLLQILTSFQFKNFKCTT
jgi:hypothetical protein